MKKARVRAEAEVLWGPVLQALVGVVVPIPGLVLAVLPQVIGRLREALFRRLPAWSRAVPSVGASKL